MEENPYLVEEQTIRQVIQLADVLEVSNGEVFRDSLKLGVEQIQESVEEDH